MTKEEAEKDGLQVVDFKKKISNKIIEFVDKNRELIYDNTAKEIIPPLIFILQEIILLDDNEDKILDELRTLVNDFFDKINGK